jgi:hypothetical protein
MNFREPREEPINLYLTFRSRHLIAKCYLRNVGMASMLAKPSRSDKVSSALLLVEFEALFLYDR